MSNSCVSADAFGESDSDSDSDVMGPVTECINPNVIGFTACKHRDCEIMNVNIGGGDKERKSESVTPYSLCQYTLFGLIT